MNLADTIELNCTPTVTGPTVAEPDGTVLLTPCDSLHSVSAQLQTVNTQLGECESKEKLLDELKVCHSIMKCKILHKNEILDITVTDVCWEPPQAIIFQDGCLRLDLWLKTFAEKLSLVEAMNLADTIELSCTPTVTGLTVAEPDGTALLTPCNSLHSVNVQLQTVNTQLEESKAKEKLLDELKEHAAILQQASPTTTMKVDQVPDLNTLEKRYWLIRHEVEKRWAQIDAQKHYHRLLL
ncbi:hypothetical protein FGIG_02290 [Fasciola gigantica]|uniref:Uncharacterized protein n=1 Tax=Fasciola gigantica TaxID=46835 RepID=A0A504Z558_FASGI|nr:hypothetical protein FGIG_02290 [Fasciola gigantica]